MNSNHTAKTWYNQENISHDSILVFIMIFLLLIPANCDIRKIKEFDTAKTYKVRNTHTH